MWKVQLRKEECQQGDLKGLSPPNLLGISDNMCKSIKMLILALLMIHRSCGRQQQFLREPTDVTAVAGQQVLRKSRFSDTMQLTIIINLRLCCPALWRTRRACYSGLKMTLVWGLREIFQGIQDNLSSLSLDRLPSSGSLSAMMRTAKN